MSDEFKIITSANENVDIVPGGNDKFPGRVLHLAESFTNTGDFGEMLFQKVGLRRLDLWNSYYHMFQETLFLGIVDKPFAEAHITLENRYVQSLGKEQDTIFEAGQCNLTAAPFMENRVLFPKEGVYGTLDIHPSLALLENLAQDFPDLSGFINTLYDMPQHAFSLYKTPLYLSPDMNYLVSRILEHLKGKNPKKSYTEVLTTELLILLLMRGETAREPDWRLKQRDIDALQHARELIILEAEKLDSEDLYDTSVQLADKIGLSVYKFKTGFKLLFGIPPYKLLIELRLYKARRFLQNTSFSVLQIALRTGYKSPEGFSRAYKKIFKKNPSEERK